MSWLVFSYSLPAQSSSSSRVALWRRLKRLGALAHKSGVYVLPDREECAESFQWLSQEVRQAKGNATFMRVEKFEGLSDNELIEMFRGLCKKDYEIIAASVGKLEKILTKKDLSLEARKIKEKLEKLRNEFSEVLRIDFFSSSYAKQTQSRLNQLEERLTGAKTKVADLPSHAISEYENKKWVTRPRPHVDRLACVWLIRKFIDQGAKIRYSNSPEPSEISFDMKDSFFGHHQNLVSFETMMAIFQLNEASLKAVAEIVHEIDLRDGRYFRPETEGVAAILKGWLQAGLSDAELETHGIALFESLYTVFSKSRKT